MDSLQNCTILILGAGGKQRNSYYQSAMDSGASLIIMQPTPSSMSTKQRIQDLREMGVTVTILDLEGDLEEKANLVINAFSDGPEINGCVTFSTKYEPLRAKLCEMLNLPGDPLASTLATVIKNETLNKLRDSIKVGKYICKSKSVSSVKETLDATEQIGFPCILKPESGHGSGGIHLIRDTDEAAESFKSLRATVSDISASGGASDTMYSLYNESILLMEYCEGVHHVVDVIIQDGRLMAAFCMDHGPTRKPSYALTTSCMPSLLDKKATQELIQAAFHSCVELGLRNGVYDLDFKRSSKTGLKLIEINCRMGGWVLHRWVKELYGVDMALCAFQIACGREPVVCPREPQEYYVGYNLTPDRHLEALQTTAKPEILRSLANKGDIIFDQYCSVPKIAGYEKPFCYIATKGDTEPEASKKLLDVCDSLGLNPQDQEYTLEMLLNFGQ